MLGIFALTGCLGEDPNSGGRVFRPGELPTGGISNAGSAFPRQVIAVSSTPNEQLELIWDPDLSTERELIGDKFNRYIQIPTDATPGIHYVSIKQPGAPDRMAQVKVLPPAPMPYPNPRIEDVAITNFSVTGVAQEAEVCTETTQEMIDSIRDGSDSLDPKFGRKYEDQTGQYSPETGTFCRTEPVAAFLKATIFITITNADADAGITISQTGNHKNVEITQTDLFSALPSREIHSRIPETYGYPVFHAVQFRVDVEGLESGAEYNIRAMNNPKRNDPDDGGRKHRSDQLVFAVPSSPDRVDSDNDRLSDVVEERLRAEGLPADPMHKTIFVEADFLFTAVPNDGIWKIAENTFARAPILNPDGSRGVSLFIDRGQDREGTGPFNRGGVLSIGHPFLSLDYCGWPGGNPILPCTSLREVKRAHFRPERNKIFHYAVFGSYSPAGSGGMAKVGGWDFVVTSWRDAAWNGEAGVIAKASTFVHELGHNLNLRHSGLPSIDTGDGNQFESPWTPNTPSIMSYRWQIDGIDRDCDFKSDRVITFSRGMYKDFDEAKTSERDGVCDNRPADIDQDATVKTKAPTVGTSYAHCWMIFNCDDDTDDIHRDGNQWGAVAFRPLEPLCTVGEPNCRSWFEERK
ncbi:MAG: hypothetical protein OEY16_04605 [Alphaproteobacteria bacterium]|nr:hypothetical protein [Alphaproteobacteria bacterium]